MTAYYNEHDAYAAAWLRNLIAEGLIAPGHVDERDIRDVRPDDVRGYTQCHWFAGIGVWSYALRLAGWPDDRPVWTGSCPCQPFSAAGRQAGLADERHLWPAWFDLIRACRPATIFGEQVASAQVVGGAKASADPAWLDVVCSDLEGARYACGAADIPAASVGAPHIRQRLWFVAVAESFGGRAGHIDQGARRERGLQPRDGGLVRRVGDADGAGCEARVSKPCAGGARSERLVQSSLSCGLADTDGRHASAERQQRGRQQRQQPEDSVLGFWFDADWIACRDGKARPVEPGTSPLVAGASFAVGSGGPFEGKSRAGMLRAYGNAINARAAAAFIAAADEALSTTTPAHHRGERTHDQRQPVIR